MSYTVEVENEGCTHCGHGKYWIVVDGDGIGGGSSYSREEDAEDIAELMNEAFEAGKSAIKKAEGK